jgi:hypothetical protein
MASRQEPVLVQGAILEHETTGARIVLVTYERGGSYLSVQLNEAEGHKPGWIHVFISESDLCGWRVVGHGE